MKSLCALCIYCGRIVFYRIWTRQYCQSAEKASGLFLLVFVNESSVCVVVVLPLSNRDFLLKHQMMMWSQRVETTMYASHRRTNCLSIRKTGHRVLLKS